MKLPTMIGTAVVPAIAAWAVAVGSSYAEHQTRQQELQESGLDWLLVGLVLAAALVAMVIFVLVVLRWERRDQEKELRER
jgi:Flp pilus assembly protein TadB